MNKYQEALNRLKTLENYLVVDNAYTSELNKNYLVKADIYDLQECVNRLADYEAMEEEFNCPLDNIMALFQVCKDGIYYFKYEDKQYNCYGVYVNGIYWSNINGAYISVSTNNEALKELEIYDVRLFAKDIGITWFI